MNIRILLGDHPHTRALRDGRVATPGLTLDFVAFEGRPPFGEFVRTQKFDMGELPLVPLLQARSFDKPIALMPVALTARFPHGLVYVRQDADIAVPADLAGRSVGVRSDAQTAVVWALGVLQNDYGLDVAGLKLVTFEEPHVAEYVARPSVRRAPEGKNLVQMLADGELDAIITDMDIGEDGRLRRLFPDHEAEAERWFKAKRVVPVGHIVAVSSNFARRHPDAVQQVFRMFRDSKSLAAAPSGSIDLYPAGLDDMRPSIELMLRNVGQLGLVRRPVSVEELYESKYS